VQEGKVAVVLRNLNDQSFWNMQTYMHHIDSLTALTTSIFSYCGRSRIIVADRKQQVLTLQNDSCLPDPISSQMIAMS